jgi:hypothetical protein
VVGVADERNSRGYQCVGGSNPSVNAALRVKMRVARTDSLADRDHHQTAEATPTNLSTSCCPGLRRNELVIAGVRHVRVSTRRVMRRQYGPIVRRGPAVL